ncbi:Group 4 capsule polysaccharide lipoprotein gfcB, YjbF [Jannaschia faecimaris]|uniref:Group 4 capsule polysaccharide lipoprotein gfcB, YjbF n=1 Tax=Jannaschia faecimaris TaxID=1244108 RepID=A0A1H3IQK4_9RHOB|nr:YjbF family lipoprotein [Jannaschia faecimaris]SDY29982.1 Group 4 capsule polysaccharide lipoprotein gfcB, YjbF [Jannaschia faecimaris]
MKFGRIAGAFTLLLALAACGNQADKNPLLLVSKAAVQTFKPGARAEPSDARDILTPALIERSDTSALLVVSLDQDQGFTVIPQTANRGTVQWRAGDYRGILRRDGIVVGTRGFGHDLYTADVDALDAAFESNGATDALRVNRYLTAEGIIEVREMICTVRLVGQEPLNIYGKIKQTRVFEEDCRDGGGDFVNRYWVERDGRVRKSNERISPEIGTFEITRLTE